MQKKVQKKIEQFYTRILAVSTSVAIKTHPFLSEEKRTSLPDDDFLNHLEQREIMYLSVV